jgi:hypothetical protein
VTSFQRDEDESFLEEITDMRQRNRLIVLVGITLATLMLAACPAPEGTPPPAPTATSDNKKVTITWPAAAGAISYNIYYKPGDTINIGEGTKMPNVISPTIVSELVNGTKYAFIVSAVDNLGQEYATTGVLTATPSSYHWGN